MSSQLQIPKPAEAARPYTCIAPRDGPGPTRQGRVHTGRQRLGSARDPLVRRRLGGDSGPECLGPWGNPRHDPVPLPRATGFGGRLGRTRSKGMVPVSPRDGGPLLRPRRRPETRSLGITKNIAFRRSEALTGIWDSISFSILRSPNQWRNGETLASSDHVASSKTCVDPGSPRALTHVDERTE